MIRKALLLLISSATLLGACTHMPINDIQLKAQADPKANFEGYKTYAWYATAEILSDAHGKWEPPAFDADAEIKFLIDRELRKKGMMQKDMGSDLVVAFAAGIDMDAIKTKVDPKTKITLLTNVPQGALQIVLLDSRTGFVVWAGSALADIQEHPSAEVAKGRLDYVVRELFRKLPK